MEKIDLLNSGADISITMRASELKKYSEKLIESAITKSKVEAERNPEEVYYSIESVAQIFNVGRSTLYRWNKRDYLKSIKVGGMVRYRKADVEAILNTVEA